MDPQMDLNREVERLKERIETLHMRTVGDRYDIANRVLGSLRFFSDHYASSQPYQEHLKQVVEMLRHQGKNASHGPLPGKFLLGLADLLEEANRPGPWPGLKP